MKKKDEFYYNNLIECADCSVRASKLLEKVMKQYSIGALRKQIQEMHAIEHEGDTKRHEMMGMLYKAFITPIEREDLIELSRCLDEITDTIEDVLLQLYICNVKKIRKDSLRMLELTAACCEELKKMIRGLKELKKGEKMKKHIIRMNDLEEEGDDLFLENMHTLHLKCNDAVEIIVWREIYQYIEKCLDACEHAADIVETVMIKNS